MSFKEEGSQGGKRGGLWTMTLLFFKLKVHTTHKKYIYTIYNYDARVCNHIIYNTLNQFRFIGLL